MSYASSAGPDAVMAPLITVTARSPVRHPDDANSHHGASGWGEKSKPSGFFLSPAALLFDWVRRNANKQKQLRTTLCYTGLRKTFVKVVCLGVLVIASFAGCTAQLSPPEALQASAPDPLISPPASLVLENPH